MVGKIILGGIGFAAASLMLVNCAPSQIGEEEVMTQEPTVTKSSPSSSSDSISTDEELAPEILLTGPYSPTEASSIMDRLISDHPAQVRGALQELEERPDPRFISVLIELMRAVQIGLVRGLEFPDVVTALESLSGETYGNNWPGWIEWYGASDLKPPPGFTGWKGELLGRIDPGFALFLRDELPSEIRVEEIQWGGVLVDGIPALDNPQMIDSAQADYLLPEEAVFGISIDGDSRAYPLRILDWHEMANDVVGGVPVSLAYCTLCGAGIAFDGRASNGETYDFGSSGFLFRSNKLMYDRQTRTLWNQLTGEPVLGELVKQGIQLELLPVVLTSWEDWQEQNPDTKVLSLNTGFERPYYPGAAYGDYFSAEATMFPVWQRSELLDAKDRIYALRIDGVPKAYPIELLAAEEVVNDTIAGLDLVLIARHGLLTVQGQNLRVGEVSYDAGGEVRAFERGEHIFSPSDQPGTVLDGTGRTWQVTEEALVGPHGQSAPRIGGHLAYWFGWFSFFPNTLLYAGE